MSTKKRIALVAGRLALRAVMGLVRVLPFGAALALGRGLGGLMRRLSRKRYNVALKNLRIAYGDALTPAEREAVAEASFRHFGMFAIEALKFGYLSAQDADRRIHVPEEAICEYSELLSHKKGCLLLTGHIGNFEVAARWLTSRGYELIALARETRDQGVTNLMTQARERSGIKVVTLGQSIKPVFAGLKRNASIAIICDQNATDVYVPFFGHPTGTVDGPARIALRMGAPMMFFACVRDGNGGYAIRSYGTHWPETTGDDQADVERATAVMNSRIEQMVRDFPEQWLWFHDRWRASPGVKDPEAVAAS